LRLQREEVDVLDAAAVDAIAEALVAARRDGVKISSPDRRIDVDEAYRIPDAVARRLGPVVGWKVGAKAADILPTCAPLVAGTVHPMGGPPVFAAGKRVGVEVEIAYRLGRALASSPHPPTDEEIFAAVASAHIAVEICDTRWRDGEQVDGAWVLADNQMNEALLVGAPLDVEAIDFADLEARLVVDGKTRVATRAGHPGGDPRRLLLWLVRHCVSARGGLSEGAIVTTGSWTGMQFAEPGQHIVAELSGLGRLAFQLA
jgi:2-keto-4-pentenoate hydratase